LTSPRFTCRSVSIRAKIHGVRHISSQTGEHLKVRLDSTPTQSYLIVIDVYAILWSPKALLSSMRRHCLPFPAKTHELRHIIQVVTNLVPILSYRFRTLLERIFEDRKSHIDRDNISNIISPFLSPCHQHHTSPSVITSLERTKTNVELIPGPFNERLIGF
jgi:hypothetical protein